MHFDDLCHLTSMVVTQAAANSVGSWEPNPDAPDNYRDLIAHWRGDVRWGGPLKVFDGASDFTIFGDPEGNYAFRAHHDWAHVMCLADFTPEGEAVAVEFQIAHINGLFKFNYSPVQLIRVANMLRAEVIGQGAYFAHHGRFPDDQKSFVRAYLDNPLAVYRSF